MIGIYYFGNHKIIGHKYSTNLIIPNNKFLMGIFCLTFAYMIKTRILTKYLINVKILNFIQIYLSNVVKKNER